MINTVKWLDETKPWKLEERVMVKNKGRYKKIRGPIQGLQMISNGFPKSGNKGNGVKGNSKNTI